jgi:hypothetical protein
MSGLQAPRPTADDSSDADASRSLAKLVIKLRWMGMEEEARRVQRSLCRAGLEGAFVPESATD